MGDYMEENVSQGSFLKIKLSHSLIAYRAKGAIVTNFESLG